MQPTNSAAVSRRALLAAGAATGLVGYSTEANSQAALWLLRIAIFFGGLWAADHYLNNGDGARWVSDKLAAERQAAFARQEAERARQEAIDGIATKLGYPTAVSEQVVDYIGVDRAQLILHGQLGLWCQRDRTGLKLNRIRPALKIFPQMRCSVSCTTSSRTCTPPVLK